MSKRERTPRRATVSPTIPFGPFSGSGSTDSPVTPREREQQGDGQMDIHEDLQGQAWYQRLVLPPHELPRMVALRDVGALAPEQTPSPASMRHDAESYVHSMVPPVSPPTFQQPRRTARPMLDGDKVVGRAFAADEAQVSAVLLDLAASILPHSPLWAGPGVPSLWKDVEAVYLPAPQTCQSSIGAWSVVPLWCQQSWTWTGHSSEWTTTL